MNKIKSEGSGEFPHSTADAYQYYPSVGSGIDVVKNCRE